MSGDPVPDRYDDSDLEAREQDRSERRLFWRQLVLMILIVVLVVARFVVV